jgi:hypothetical protein
LAYPQKIDPSKQARRRSDVRGDAHSAAQQMPINVPTHNQQIASLLNQPNVPMPRGVPAAAAQTPQGVAFRNNANAPNNRAPALSVQQPHNFLQQIPSRVSTVNASSASRKGSAPGRVPLANFRGPAQQQQQRFTPTVE